MIVSSTTFLNQNGPIIRCFVMSHQAVHFTECKLTAHCYWHFHRTRRMLRCWTKHHQGSQDHLQSYYRTTGRLLNIFPYQLIGVYAWSGFCMSTAEEPSLRFFATMHVKDWVLRNVFRETFFGHLWESLTAFRFLGHLAVNFLPDLGFPAFLLSCLLALWLEMSVPNDKLVFLWDNC